MTDTTKDAGSTKLEVSDQTAQSACNALLVCFHRYRDALKSHPSNEWDTEKLTQWKDDRKFLNEVYNNKRSISFGFASDYAHDQLFMRCFNISN